MSEQYGKRFWRRLFRDFKHLPRVMKFRCREIQNTISPLSASCDTHLKTSALMRPPAHRYAGYGGPWFEEIFYNFWVNDPGVTGAFYVPVFWNYIYQHIQAVELTPRRYRKTMSEMEEVKRRCDEIKQPCFTIIDYDHSPWDWHAFPKNVVVFASGGDGDVPIPLLKGNRPYSNPPKSIRVSFMGRLDGASDHGGIRSAMHRALKDHAHFGFGAEWESVMAKSVFTLCPRGLGRASFRFYEAMSVGSIPIYIWDDKPWLPFADVIDWNELIVGVPVVEVEKLPEKLCSLSETQIQRMQTRIKEVYHEYITPEAVFKEIRRRASGMQKLEDVLKITSQRVFAN